MNNKHTMPSYLRGLEMDNEQLRQENHFLKEKIMNTPNQQLGVIDLTKLIREIHYQLQLDHQNLLLKATALEQENKELKERLEKLDIKNS